PSCTTSPLSASPALMLSVNGVPAVAERTEPQLGVGDWNSATFAGLHPPPDELTFTVNEHDVGPAAQPSYAVNVITCEPVSPAAGVHVTLVETGFPLAGSAVESLAPAGSPITPSCTTSPASASPAFTLIVNGVPTVADRCAPQLGVGDWKSA